MKEYAYWKVIATRLARKRSTTEQRLWTFAKLGRSMPGVRR